MKAQKKEYKEIELPHYNAIDKATLYQFSIPDLLADIALFAFSFLLSKSLFTNNGFFFQLQPWQILLMFCIITLTLPWYFGYIYVWCKAYYSKIVLKISLIVFIAITLTILIRLMTLVISVGPHEGETDFEGIDGFTAFFASFLLILGPMMSLAGSMSAQDRLTNPNQNTSSFDSDKFMSGIGAFLILIMGIAYMVFFIGLFPKEYSGIGVVVSFIGGPLAGVITMGLLFALITLIDKIGLYKYLVKGALIFFPLFITSTLVFWSGVSMYYFNRDFGNLQHSPMAYFLLCFFITGLIPFRIVMIFRPPLNILNMIFGIISLLFFMYNTFKFIF